MAVLQTPAAERAARGLTETPRRPARRRRKTQYQGSARGFIAPGVFLVAVLLYLPLLWTTFLSFTEYNGLGDPEWVGLDNYVEMFEDPAFVGSLMNTLLWVAGTLLIPVGVGLALALLTWNLPGGIWLRLPFLIPYAISGIGVGVIWSFILSANGALDQALAVFGITDPPRWLVDAPLNTFVMIIAVLLAGRRRERAAVHDRPAVDPEGAARGGPRRRRHRRPAVRRASSGRCCVRSPRSWSASRSSPA